MNWLEKYHEYTKEFEAVKHFHEWGALYVVASALSSRCWTNLGAGRIFPNIYVILVAPPAVARKGEVIGTAESLLLPLEEEMLVYTSAESITNAKLFDDLVLSKALIEIDGNSYEHMGLSATSAELGSFVKVGERDLVNTLIELFDGKRRHRHATRKDGAKVLRNVVLNMLAGTTPEFFKGLEFEARIRSGFTSRCIFQHAEARRWNKSDPYINKKLHGELVDDLRKMTTIYGHIPLTTEAQEYYQNWYENMPIRPDVIPPLIPYYGRKQTHVRKVAMLFTAMDIVEGAHQETEIEHIKKAESVVESAEKYMSGAFMKAGRNDDMANITDIITTLQFAMKWLSRSEIMKKHFCDMVPETVSQILGYLYADMGVIEQRTLGGKLYYRWKGEKK